MDISIICTRKELYPVLAEIGYRGIDFTINDTENALNEDYYAKLRDIRKCAVANKLYVAQTHLPLWPSHYKPIGDGSYRDYEEYMLPRIRRAIELTGEFGCRTAVLHPFYTSTREESVSGNVQMIEKLIPVLEKSNVILSLENIYDNDYNRVFASTAEDFLYYINYFKHPLLGICLDTGHALIQDLNPNELLKAEKNYLTALHVHSTSYQNDMHTVPGITGGVDWNLFAEDLLNSPYKGTFNMEVKAPQYNLTALRSFYKLAFDVATEILNRRL